MAGLLRFRPFESHRLSIFGTARARLVAWNVSVLSLFLVVLFGVVYADFHQNIYKAVDGQLASQRERLRIPLEQSGGNIYSLFFMQNPNLFDQVDRAVATDSTGHPRLTNDCIPAFGVQCPIPRATSPDGIREALKHGQDLRTVEFDGTPRRVLTFTVSVGNQITGVLQLSEGATGEEQALHELTVLLVAGVIVGALLAATGSLFLAGRALVPIRQAFSRQRQFTADASHELRTPLALIRANAEMLTLHGTRLAQDDAELVQEIIRETDHLNRMVGDLLTLARADSEMLELRTKPMDFRALVEDVHDDVQRIAESRGIASRISLNGPVRIQGDEVRLRQLLLILLDNALKYTDAGGEVDVSLSPVDNRARLVVSDTGIGIPSKDIGHIFDRFYRVDRAREHQSGGTGLGLAIARWIVQAHHGSIKVESEVGKGSRFQVELPTT